MNKFLSGTLFLAALLSVTSCIKVNFDEGETVAPPVDPNSNVITGKITTSRYFPRGTYILKGYVYVTEGATVTFEAGTIVKSDITEKGALIIERGAKIIADGRANNPIVFTSGKAVGQRQQDGKERQHGPNMGCDPGGAKGKIMRRAAAAESTAAAPAR